MVHPQKNRVHSSRKGFDGKLIDSARTERINVQHDCASQGASRNVTVGSQPVAMQNNLADEPASLLLTKGLPFRAKCQEGAKGKVIQN
jgi:hypothetical protein